MKTRLILAAVCVLGVAWLLGAQTTGYRSPDQIGTWLQNQHDRHGHVLTVQVLARSPGQRPVYLATIRSAERTDGAVRPAILVVANPSGQVPLASEGALRLVERLLAEPERYRDLDWYVVPSLNPDAHQRCLAPLKEYSVLNEAPVDADRDGQEGEDPADDLNGDGLITRMRVADPEGEWLPDEREPRLLRRADPLRGERGIYKLYDEGIDNDGDGRINEDGPGGVDVAVNFPHLFPARQVQSGEWPGSESEAFELIRFVAAHREIAMTLVLGEGNFCYQVPQGGRRGQTDFSKITVPEDIGKRFGIDTGRTYTMAELMVQAQKMAPPDMDLTEATLASFLGLGAVVNPLPEDLKFYQRISDDYRSFLGRAKLPTERFAPARDRDGSFELWAYYHLGLPSFSLDFWSVPQTGKTKEETDALTGTDKPQSGADPLESALLRYSDQVLDKKGFVPWSRCRHPGFGEVEVGGFIPGLAHTPPAAQMETLLHSQISWIFELAARRARLSIHSTKIEPEGAGLYRVSAWIENRGMLPYPTAMGMRNRRTRPVIVVLDGPGLKILKGKKRERIALVGGNGLGKVEWLIRLEGAARLQIRSSSDYAGVDTRTVSVGGAQ